MALTVEPAVAADAPTIRDLLASSGLPVDDLDRAPIRFWVARDASHVVGAIGLERYGSAALLRSLVVAADYRHQGLGRQLIATLERDARGDGVGQLVLLTQTAVPLFSRLGYATIDRANVPGGLAASAQLRSLCPASAACMSKLISPAHREATMTERIYNVLFLCTGNSARSVLAESILNQKGKGRFRAYSAGSFPTGKVNPAAIELLTRLGFPTQDLRSKSWDEFAAPGAPPLDFIITVCDNAAGEVCPVWPGKPVTAHWGVADPAHVEGGIERAQAFREAFRVLERRIDLFLQLPLETLERLALSQKMRDIGTVTQ